jgi:hypothetical protein
MQHIILTIISIVAVIFFITSHFKKQIIDKKVFNPFLVFMFLLIINFIQFKRLQSQVDGLVLRFVLGNLIGILQGFLAKVTVENNEIFTQGTLLGMVFWLIFIPVRLVILPWIEVIAPGKINLNNASYLGISALYIFTGFFLAKAVTLHLRKKSRYSSVF